VVGSGYYNVFSGGIAIFGKKGGTSARNTGVSIAFGVLLLLLVSGATLGVFILYPLLVGLLLFSVLAMQRGYSLRAVGRMLLSGAAKTLPVVNIFVLIGIMIGLWFASGTIAIVVYYGLSWMVPSLFILFCFLLSTVVSLLLGTSFGTVGTIGVVLMIMARTGSVHIAMVSGAIIGGAYVGDRISPMSSSAHLVATVSGTKIYANIRRMARTTPVPFLGSVALYAVLSLLFPFEPGQSAILGQISSSFTLSGWNLVPVGVLVMLIAFRLNVKWAMFFSSLAAAGVALWVQGVSLPLFLRSMTLGFSLPRTDPLHAIFQGGGIAFMFKAILTVLASSAFSGLFEHTDLIRPFEDWIEKITKKTGKVFGAIVSSVVTSSLGCTQALAIIMSHHVLKRPYQHLKATSSDLALDLEDTVVVLSVLIPWNVAGSMPAQMLGSDARFIPFAFFLFLLPAWRLWKEQRSGKPREKGSLQ